MFSCFNIKTKEIEQVSSTPIFIVFLMFLLQLHEIQEVSSKPIQVHFLLLVIKSRRKNEQVGSEQKLN